MQSSLEDFRDGGPRPTDRDDLDLHQAFADLRVPFSGSDELTLRAGRQEMAYGSQRLISVRESPNNRLGPQNIMDLQPGVDFTLVKGLKLTTSCDFVWRESLDDGVYGVALNLQVPPGASQARYVGTFPSASLAWQAGRHLNLTLNYVTYLFGDFVKQSIPNQRNGSYVSAVATVRF